MRARIGWVRRHQILDPLQPFYTITRDPACVGGVGCGGERTWATGRDGGELRLGQTK